MLSVGPARVFLATEPVDLRRGHDGLFALVRASLGMDPFTGDLFVFVGRRGDRIKILFWDRGGFVVYLSVTTKFEGLVVRKSEGLAGCSKG